ncbi:MAG: HD domain-containing protein [Lachnospiraceae bacterium]|nr:HD domain-containing protein [Lachnospiraceae bacterium]
MERINRILKHNLFLECIAKTESLEADRKFCHHDMVHFLDVARLAMILNLKEGLGVDEDYIYAAALLHDIGRFRQYEDGTPHEKASAGLAPKILQECGFDDKETNVIIRAILGHRNPQSASERNLTGLLYRADKMSRSCFCCKAEAECNWKEGKKNRELHY